MNHMKTGNLNPLLCRVLVKTQFNSVCDLCFMCVVSLCASPLVSLELKSTEQLNKLILKHDH